MIDIDDMELAHGTVGFPDTQGNPFQVGDGSGTENGLTLVEVTLFHGYRPTTGLNASIAQGTRILCQMASLFLCIPPRGTRVIVGMPRDVAKHPGASVILQIIDTRGQQIFGSDYSAGDVVVPALTSTARLKLKGDGSISVTNDKATISIDASGNVEIDVPNGSTVKLAGGGAGVARSGDAITISQAQFAAAGPVANLTSGAVTITAPMQGSIPAGSSIVSSG